MFCFVLLRNIDTFASVVVLRLVYFLCRLFVYRVNNNLVLLCTIQVLIYSSTGWGTSCLLCINIDDLNILVRLVKLVCFDILDRMNHL